MNLIFKRSVLVMFLIAFGLLFTNAFSPVQAFAETQAEKIAREKKEAEEKAKSSTNINDPNQVSVGVSADSGLSVTGGGFSKTGSASAWGALIDKYKIFITGIAGIGAVTMVVLFIIQFMKLGASAGNPNARSQALVGCLWTGISATGLGAVTLIVGFFYNAVQ